MLISTKGDDNVKKSKQLISIAAAVMMFTAPVYAADAGQIQAAYSLYSMGLFSGTGTNADGTPIFELDESITRAQAVTLIVMALGKGAEAESGNFSSPFTDLPQWAEKYINYAYANGYTGGISSTEFAPNDSISANQFCAFILRSLGYSESDRDFEYKNALKFSAEMGIAESSYSGTFTRGDAAEILYNALSKNIKSTEVTLYQYLYENGCISSAYNKTETAKISENREMNAEEIYAKYSSAVFYIEVCDESGKPMQLGSGFFIDSDGTAVTNYHVLDGGSSAKITLSDGGQIYDVEGVYDYDKERDIALIKIKGSGFPYLETADSDDIKGGATVYAIGSPLGLSNTISQGIISNTDRTINGQNYIQISAAISNGSSGGALINTYGKVIGITSGEAAQSTSSGTITGQNLNLAIPINCIKSLKKGTLTSMADIYQKEIKGNAKIELSSENVSLSVGQTSKVSVKCSADIKAYLTGSVSRLGVVNAKFVKTDDGSEIILTGLSDGTASIELKMRDSSGRIIAEKTINVTVK